MPVFSAPSNFRADLVQSRSAVLSWSCPAEGCRCVDQFLVEWRDQAGQGQLKVDGRELEATVPHLLPCTDYAFTVAAETVESGVATGAGLQLQTKEVGPGPVQQLHQQSATPDGVEVLWHPPTQDPQCVGSYEVSWDSTCGVDRMTAKSTAPSSGSSIDWETYVITGLDCSMCDAYNLTVSAVSPLGLAGQGASTGLYPSC